MRGAALFMVALTASACSTDRCKQGTVFVSVSLTNGAEAANAIDVQLSIDGDAAQTKTVSHATGSTSGSIEVDFGSYPGGRSLSFTLVARADDQMLASASKTITALATCTTVEMMLDGASPPALDMTAIDEAAQDDLTGTIVDLSLGPDLAPQLLCATTNVSTLSGDGSAGFADGTTGSNTEFNAPVGLRVDATGNVYVADSGNNRIRKVAPGGSTTTVAGNGTAGFADGTGGATGTAEFNAPTDVVLDASGNLFVADNSNNRIRKVTPDGTTTTLAGNGTFGFNDGTGGPSGTTEFKFPSGLVQDSAGNLYVADYANERIRKVATNGNTTTFTGNGILGFSDGSGGATGTTEFTYPAGLAIDSSGRIFVGAQGNHRIRRLALDGSTTTPAGNGTAGYADGTGGATGTAEFNLPYGVAVDSDGNVYVADASNNRIRRIAADGTTKTLAGNGTTGFPDGVGCSAHFTNPRGIALSGKMLFVGDTGNNRIRVIQLP